MIRVLDIPGVLAIENRVRLNSLTATRQDFELQNMVNNLVRQTLGIWGDPNDLIWDHDYRAALDETDDQDEAADAANDQETNNVEDWRADGWDVTGDDGKELLSLGMYEDALCCVNEGIAGIEKVKLEAMLWTARKAAESRVPPKEKARNQAFLSLGRNSRRRA